MTPTIEHRVSTLEQIVAGRFPNTIHAQRVHMVETIIAIVADEFNLRPDFMLGDKRVASVVWPRHIALSLAYEFSGLSTSAIAPLFNRLDHSTVLHAVNRVRHDELHSKVRAREVAGIRERVEKALAVSRNGV